MLVLHKFGLVKCWNAMSVFCITFDNIAYFGTIRLLIKDKLWHDNTEIAWSVQLHAVMFNFSGV